MKSYVTAGLGLLLAGAQAALLATVPRAAPTAVERDALSPLTLPERTPRAVWMGGPVVGLRVARVDAHRVILAGAADRVELRLPPAARARPVGLAAAQTALRVLGAPYRWGATGGRSGDAGFDCSGLIWMAFARHGVELPRVSREQARTGVPVARNVRALEPGDLLAFSAVPRGVVEHVGLYVGAGRFVHSAGGGVVVSALSPDDARGRWWWRRWVGARRVEAKL